MNTTHTHTQQAGVRHRLWLALGLMLAAVAPLPVTGGNLDICGCEGHPDSLGDFDNRTDPSTWPAGITQNSCNDITIELPPDGVLIFDSFYVDDVSTNRICNWITDIYFTKNADNTPVTMLVAGDFTLRGDNNFFRRGVVMHLQGNNGGVGTSSKAGVGGAPGPGGFRGGNGASLDLNATDTGGPGLGPGGGGPGIGNNNGGDARYMGRPELRPMIGGGGGGGGGSSASGNCSGGGGGGGGGALTLAVNGTLRLQDSRQSGSEVFIRANGGNRGLNSITACSRPGGLGSGGAIRLMAHTFNGNGGVYAQRGDNNSAGVASGGGIIRIEAFVDNHSRPDYISPGALRSAAIGPVVNPLASTIAITAVDGEVTPAILTGSTGGIDVVVSAPGLITFQVETVGVPSGTTVDVAAKPQVGGLAFIGNVTLAPGACNTAGECTVFATIDLPSNAYFVEATATFRTP